MNAVFADTSYYFVILNPRDQYHAAATQISLQLSQRVVTSEFVLVELGNAMTSPQSRDTYVRMVGHLRSSEQMTIIPATGQLFEDGLQLFAARKDKSWSIDRLYLAGDHAKRRPYGSSDRRSSLRTGRLQNSTEMKF